MAAVQARTLMMFADDDLVPMQLGRVQLGRVQVDVDLGRPHLLFQISHRVAARQSASRGWRQRSPALPYPER